MKSAFRFITPSNGSIKDDMLSGFTVALALVPEAVAFAFVAGISPIIGLYGAFMMGLVTAIFGGRPGMISGATGALAVVMVHLIREGNAIGPDGAMMGLQFLFATLILTGIFQALAGVLRMGKFVRMIPHSVMMGFVNGLAIVIFTSQLGMFQIGGEWIESGAMLTMLGLVALTMGIMFVLPKITKKIPDALAAIIVVSILVIFGDIDTQTVKSFIVAGGGEGIKAGLPTFNIPMIALNLETLGFITPYALILAAIGLIESLMTLNLIDELTETHGNGNKECIAQGGANILNGFFGGMGGCAMIGQSIINIKGGGRGRLSGITAALALLFFILFASGLIEQVPIAALVGVMFMVVIGTFAWSSFRILNKIPFTDVIVIIAVSAITVWKDLAVAVIAGVIISALVFAWENARKIRAKKTIKKDGTKVYEIWGPLFFGSISAFNSKFAVQEDPKKIEIDFIDSKVSDFSGIEAIFNLVEKYHKLDKEVKLTHLSDDCKAILHKAHPIFHGIIEDDVNDPRYFVVSDLIKEGDLI